MARWRSSRFSTTVTWNCRGRQMIGGGGQEGHRRPARAEDVGALDHRGRHVGEDGAEPAGDAPDREDADGEQGDELDDRLDGDGGDDAVVALVGVEVAGAEQDGEEREARSDQGGGGAPGLAAGDHLVAAGYRLELERDVGRDRHDRDQGDEDGEGRALAVARRDQVGDRGDAVHAADAHELAQDRPPADEDQRRAEVDGDELEPAARGRPDGAVEGPGGAVDRDRQRVDDRRAHPAQLALPGAAVDVEGEREKRRDVAKADGEQEVEREHQSWPGAARSRRDRRAAAAIRSAQTPKT